MKRFITGAVVASLSIAGTVAPASVGAEGAKKPSPRAKVLKGKLMPVPVGDYGMLVDARGRVELTDGKRNDKVSIHVRELAPGATYAWRIVEGGAGARYPCAGATAVDGWTYKPLKASRSGNANSKGRSKTFAYDPAKSYSVGLFLADGHAFLCAELKSKKKAKSKGKSGDKPATKDTAKGRKS